MIGHGGLAIANTKVLTLRPSILEGDLSFPDTFMHRVFIHPIRVGAFNRNLRLEYSKLEGRSVLNLFRYPKVAGRLKF